MADEAKMREKFEAAIKRRYPHVDLKRGANGEYFSNIAFGAWWAWQAALASREVCVWRAMDDDNMPGTYEGSCGAAWTFNDGTPVENDMRFCPQCGGVVQALAIIPEAEQGGRQG